MVGVEGDEEIADSAKALADMLRQGAGRTMIVSQILTNKAIKRLLSIARGEPQPEPATESGESAAENAEAAPAAEAEAQDAQE
jgi:hypothetical protein